jgi:hypothetical protein
MFGLRTFNFLRLIFIACLLFGARAFAQFEVAPDHFPSEPERPVRDTGKDKARTAVPKDRNAAMEQVSMRAPQLNQRIAEQQSIITECRALISAKRQQMEAAWQSLLHTGNEAGEAEALTIYQRELDNLENSLAPAIHTAEVTLARLQAELATSSQLRTSPAKRRAL